MNLFAMIMPDILHAIEQGVWRAVATHLMRLVQILEKRHGLQQVNYRFVPFSLCEEVFFNHLRPKQIQTYTQVFAPNQEVSQ